MYGAADAWQWIDGVETVSYTGPDGVVYATVKAKRAELTWGEVAFGGAVGIAPTDLPWIVWASTLDAEPKPLGRLTDASGVSWQVVAVAGQHMGATVIRWRLVCRKEV